MWVGGVMANLAKAHQNHASLLPFYPIDLKGDEEQQETTIAQISNPKYVDS